MPTTGAIRPIPSFFVTEDIFNGALRRFTPDATALRTAETTGDYTNLLHSNPGGTASIDFLRIEPSAANPWKGKISWSNNLNAARSDAEYYYPFSEGIDVRDGILYVTAKAPKILLMIDLAKETYEIQSTVSGAFDGQPDQVQRIFESQDESLDDSILYFCEDGKGSNAGVHGRDAQANFYTILNAPGLPGESTGLAFSPDSKHMYVAFQDAGLVFDVTRTDGYPFGGMRLDIKYHSADDDDGGSGNFDLPESYANRTVGEETESP